ncbi:MAG: hypothetical protein KME32_29330 [Mojavia pulchra JT2-VF2]|jgi:hypothetical protein|uniref:Uncharacterized protein n=1 Tax=Mojavia pulchra JT2-VF2 TaxID=287848 RepID=A0A951UIZ1_9NOST|nr:hypothetical protein [Mojavia pulchra JT2-VF2]
MADKCDRVYLNFDLFQPQKMQTHGVPIGLVIVPPFVANVLILFMDQATSITNIKAFVTDVLILFMDQATFITNIKAFVVNVLMIFMDQATFITNIKAFVANIVIKPGNRLNLQ